MRSTLNHVHTSRNAAQRDFDEHRSPVHPDGTASGTSLNEQAESTILAVVACIVLASLSVGCVIGIGVCRTLGAR